MRKRSPHPSILARAAAVALLVAVALPLAAPAAAGKKPALGSTGGLKVLGRLPEPTIDGVSSKFVIQVDPERRLLYYLWRRGTDFYLREYDLRPAIPTLRRETFIGTYAELEINSATPYTMQLDSINRRLLLLGQSAKGSAIRIVDLDSFEVVSTWDIASVLPGFVAQGMTYVARDKRIYLVGSQSGNTVGTTNVIVSKPAQAAQVVALTPPADPAAGAEIAWVRPIPQCQQVMDTYTVGALLARSQRAPALYFACVRTDPWPGESGLVRLTIDPKAAPADAADFPVEFFPVSGSYNSPTHGIIGIAAFNYATDRFYMQSLATSTPGAWVFDGELSAWTGFIAAPDHTNQYVGLDQSSGHYYMAGLEVSSQSKYENAYTLVTDGNQTPVPQGEVFPGLGTTGFIVVDPVTHRLFAPMRLDKLGMGEDENTDSGIIVLQDSTPLDAPPAPTDYDELTEDIPEGPKTITSFSGGVNGYGGRVVLVGGYGGLVSATGQQVPIGQVRSGDRGITAARVPSVDIRAAGASATAQPLLSDTNTDAELNDVGAGEWPWAPASCLNGGGDALEMETSGPGGSSRVSCDLTKQQTEAASEFGALSAGGVSIGSSSVHARAWRDEKSGVLTETMAQASGIELAAPDGQKVSIAQVAATATTSAHGRPGTAKATWVRSISGVVVTDAEGKVTQRLGGCTSEDKENSCGDLAKELNALLQTKMRIDLPQPDVMSTPKGAFAAVQQNDRDFHQGRTVDNQGTTFAGEAASRAVPTVQITVFNDSVEKSRALVQLAAIQANSIYTNSLAPGYDSEDPVDGLTDKVAEALPPPPSAPSSDSVGAAVGGDLQSATGDAAPASDTVAAPALVGATEGVLAFLRRGPKEALLFAGFWLLFAAAGAAAVRRRSLMNILTTTGAE
jgi:hypothetical protein